MFVKANINKAIISTPAISINHWIKLKMTSDNALWTIRHYFFSINITFTFQQSKYNCFTWRSAAFFSSNSPSAKVRFIKFNYTVKWWNLFTFVCYFLRILMKIELIKRTEILANWAVSVAVKSMAKSESSV